jgi:putative membrane protein
MIFGGLLILFWGVITLVAWPLRSLVGANNNHASDLADGVTGVALEILKERYARGEISKAEYEEMRDVLRT